MRLKAVESEILVWSSVRILGRTAFEVQVCQNGVPNCFFWQHVAISQTLTKSPYVAMSYSHFGLKGGILLLSRLLVRLRCSFKTWLWFVLLLLFPSYCWYCSCFHLFSLLLGAYQNDGGWWWLVRWSWVLGNGFFNSSCWGTMCKVPYSVMKASWFGCMLCSCMGRFPAGFAVGRWDLELNGVSQDPRWDQRSGYLEDLRPRGSKVNAGLKQSLWQHVRVFRYISL